MADRLHRQPSASSRASVRRQRSARSSIDDDVFGDEHAIDNSTITDGFAPAPAPDAAAAVAPALSHSRSPPRTTNPRLATPRSSEEPGSDMQKRRSLYQLGPQMSGSRSSLLARPEMSQRPSSIVSTLSIPRAQSPYVGASRPSHPYAMYPQDASSSSLNRSSTVSTVRPADRPYSGPSHPNHPYAMFSQSTMPDMANDPMAASRDIATLSFPVYARRNGPGGEDADDLIAMDGYTEQLPPYTRYPDARAHKERYAPGSESLLSPQPSNRLDASSSQEEGLLDSSRIENAEEEREGEEGEEGGGQTNEAAEGADDDEAEVRAVTSKARWAKKGRRRFFRGRIPAWVICLGMLLLVVIAATLGGVIGRYLPHNSHQPHTPDNNNNGAAPENVTNPLTQTAIMTVTTTTLLDATPLASIPANLPPLPTGSYGFAMIPPSQASSSCLSGPGQASAWSCTDSGYMLFNVTPSDVDATHVSLAYNNPSGMLQYGDQPPTLNSSIGLTLMSDLEEPTLGPAYFFQLPFVKQVILPGIVFNESNSKRSLNEKIAQAFQKPRDLYPRGGNVSPGESPWVCLWNGTLLEGFIYISQPGLSSVSSSESLTSTTQATSASAPSVTSLSTSAAYSQPTTTSASMQPRHWKFHGSSGSDTADFDGFGLPYYPKAMKISERRVPGNPQRPFCIQMTVNDDLSMSPILDVNEKPIEITLDEVEPETQQRVATPNAANKRDDSESACLCQWLLP